MSASLSGRCGFLNSKQIGIKVLWSIQNSESCLMIGAPDLGCPELIRERLWGSVKRKKLTAEDLRQDLANKLKRLVLR